MSKINTEKKLVSRKLVLNREVLRALSAETLKEVVGGWPSWACVTMACPNTSVEIYCGPLR